MDDGGLLPFTLDELVCARTANRVALIIAALIRAKVGLVFMLSVELPILFVSAIHSGLP